MHGLVFGFVSCPCFHAFYFEVFICLPCLTLSCDPVILPLFIGLSDLMQCCVDRSVVDLKQCMPVTNFVQPETTPIPRDCEVWHQSTVRAIREQSAESASAASPERLYEL